MIMDASAGRQSWKVMVTVLAAMALETTVAAVDTVTADLNTIGAKRKRASRAGAGSAITEVTSCCWSDTERAFFKA